MRPSCPGLKLDADHHHGEEQPMLMHRLNAGAVIGIGMGTWTVRSPYRLSWPMSLIRRLYLF